MINLTFLYIVQVIVLSDKNYIHPQCIKFICILSYEEIKSWKWNFYDIILHMLAFFMLSTVPYQQPLLSPLEMLSFSNFLVHLLGWNLSICFVFKNPRNGLGCLQFVIHKVNVYMIMLVQFSIMSYFLSIMVIHTVQEADLSPFLV